MNHIASLRVVAAEKRDRAIAKAKQDYKETIAKLDAVALALLDAVTSEECRISHRIESLIPRSEAFSVRQIMEGLEQMDPTRRWDGVVVRQHLTYLRRRGIIKRVRRASTKTPAMYVRTQEGIEASPDRDRPLIEILKSVATKPMTTTEFAVAATEAGYQTQQTPARFRNTIATVLGKLGLKRDGKNWLPPPAAAPDSRLP